MNKYTDTYASTLNTYTEWQLSYIWMTTLPYVIPFHTNNFWVVSFTIFVFPE